MKKLLISGFEPFGGETVNPSWEAVCRLDDTIGEFALVRILLPVVFGEAAEMLVCAAEEQKPDVILCIGQAGGRSAITPELVGINLRHGTIPDNKGNMPEDERIAEGGPDAHFSTLPVRKMVSVMRSLGIAAEVSYSAGAYVCNDVLYTLLDRFAASDVRVGFVHVPYVTEQQKSPAMELSEIQRALTLAIGAIDG